MVVSRFPLRIALTVLGFMLVFPVVGGMVLAISAAAINASAPASVQQRSPEMVMAGLLLGMLAYVPPATVTGIAMSLMSSRIRSKGAWIGRSMLAGSILVMITGLIMMRSMFTTGPLLASLVFVGALTVCSVPGSLFAALATLGVRRAGPALMGPGASEP